MTCDVCINGERIGWFIGVLGVTNLHLLSLRNYLYSKLLSSVLDETLIFPNIMLTNDNQ
jgi:hypothetical protein